MAERLTNEAKACVDEIVEDFYAIEQHLVDNHQASGAGRLTLENGNLVRGEERRNSETTILAGDIAAQLFLPCLKDKTISIRK